ncbi:MAG TPA: hypothetical protein VHZ78_09045 [Rhizomicrobium sp.]|nr:hypothetical protein [Rhizomicrobium sp.]
MKTISIAIASAVLLCAAPAFADDDVMAGFYGNTVISTGGGIESRTHFKADHTFDATFTAAAGSFASKGTWAISGGQVCRTYDPAPPGVSNPVCVPADPHKAGDSWTVTVNGATRDVTLKAGAE